MKHFFILICVLSSMNSAAQEKVYENDSMILKVNGKDSTYIEKPFRSGNSKYVYKEDPKIMPSYKGDINRFIKEHLRYPKDAMRKKTEGRVRVDAYINAEGKVAKKIILKYVSASVDAEAMRIVSLMKDWQPAEIDGRKIGAWYTIEVPFKLK